MQLWHVCRPTCNYRDVIQLRRWLSSEEGNGPADPEAAAKAAERESLSLDAATATPALWYRFLGR